MKQKQSPVLYIILGVMAVVQVITLCLVIFLMVDRGGSSVSREEVADRTINYTEEMAGVWYQEGNTDYSVMELYTDGTCTVTFEYGTCSWSIVNDGELKLVSIYGEVINFYGEQGPMKLKECTGDRMVLCDDQGENEVVLIKQ